MVDMAGEGQNREGLLGVQALQGIQELDSASPAWPVPGSSPSLAPS